MAGHKKPVGKDGSLTHRTGPGVDERTFNRYVSPKEKALIEAEIAAKFIDLVGGSADHPAATLAALPENDLDFLWNFDGREAKIELTELVLTTPPYQEDGDSAVIHCKPWAEKFFDLVEKKNTKSYKDSLPIDLLVYTTHFAYHGNQFCTILAAERMRCFAGGANFDRVYYLEYCGEVSRLYGMKPYRDALNPRLRREYEGHWYSPVNFSKGSAVPGGTMFAMDLPPIPRRP